VEKKLQPLTTMVAAEPQREHASFSRLLRTVLGFLAVAAFLDFLTVVRLQVSGAQAAYQSLVFLFVLIVLGLGVASIMRYRLQTLSLFLYFAGLFFTLGAMYGVRYMAAELAQLATGTLHPYLLWFVGRWIFVVFFFGAAFLVWRRRKITTSRTVALGSLLGVLSFLSVSLLRPFESALLQTHVAGIGRPWEIFFCMTLTGAGVLLSRVSRERRQEPQYSWISLFFGFQILASVAMLFSWQELDLWFFFAFLLQLTGFFALPLGFATELAALFEERERLLEHVRTQKTVILQEEARLSAIINALPIGFVLLRANGLRPIVMNGQIAQIFDGESAVFGDPKAMIRRFEVQHRDGTPYTPAQLVPALVVRSQKAVTDEDMVIMGNGGERRSLRIAGAPIRDAKGAVSMVIVLVEDISERVRLTQQLTDRENALQSAYERSQAHEKEIIRLKDEFVFVAAHELRAPVNAIRWNIEFLKEQKGAGRMPKAVKERFGDIDQASAQLLLLVEDLLNIARLEEGTVPVVPALFSLKDAVDAAVRVATPLAKKAGIRLECAAFTGTVYADLRRVTEVVQNLLTNAVKYNRPNGSVALSMIEEKDRVRILVKDTGIGIAPADLAKMFTKFFRVQRTETQHIEGTGLGLFIVQNLLQRMGGSIRVESTLNVGSTFIVELPKTAPAASTI
jgi:signal transduction histidine kinase